ncbi:MAG: hypothetical protein ACOC0P_02890 [Planctomycetota bacterium]
MTSDRKNIGKSSSDGDANNENDREELIERTLNSWRPRDRDGRITTHPAWYDLSEADRVAAYRRLMAWRKIEAAANAKGLSSTSLTVLRRIADGDVSS